jgi:hypothetical protein
MTNGTTALLKRRSCLRGGEDAPAITAYFNVDISLVSLSTFMY